MTNKLPTVGSPRLICRLQGKVDEEDFEGTLVLEKLAEIGRVDEFFDAIDSDDFDKAKSLMRRAGIETPTIKIVLEKMAAADGDH